MQERFIQKYYIEQPNVSTSSTIPRTQNRETLFSNFSSNYITKLFDDFIAFNEGQKYILFKLFSFI